MIGKLRMGVREVKHGFASTAYGQRLGIYLSGSWAVGSGQWAVGSGQWAEEHAVAQELISPGKPMQNAFIERFNRTYRTEILDFYLFRTLNEVREITERWLNEYNSERPHESLNNLTPEEYRLMAEKPEISKSAWN